ncbi:MAG TPA: phenylalanine--tRNA ligase subunit beta [Candidatus Baltobacteraceae bacterium]|nr:phenylalanine--tRNA ligase subunit beta [Candidatus Baltobacteraceae bacterium]
MLVPISWLREYVDLPEDSQIIADRLAMLGFPVEEIVRRPEITGVVVGKIVALEKHPNADRLQVGQIDVGTGTNLTIATAATNVAVGQTIPVATIGAKLPHLTIEPRKMRGVDSQGMMVSADELALPADWFEDGIMQLDPGTPLGANVIELFGLAADVLDVEITSNRVDAMCAIGIARELAASYGVEPRTPSFENPGSAVEPVGKEPRVTIESPDCKRFVAQRFEGIAVGPAPAWMRIRLALAGQRPINNLVDISNYVMLETGQPLHFYDAERVVDQHIVVRDARDGETLTTLDGATHPLTAQALVTADDTQALGLAGLMGGASSEVRDATTAIVLEAAAFEGARVRRMSMQYGFRSEASSRHEKNVPLALGDMGAARAAQLLVSLGAHAYRPHIFGAQARDAVAIALTQRDVRRLLGIDLSVERIAGHLRLLGCETIGGGDTLAVTPPGWRNDLWITADLVEEVARMEGYDSIEAIEPAVPSQDISSATYVLENAIATTLASLGYNEIITYSLQGPRIFDHVERSGIAPSHSIVEVRNPLSEDQRYLRWALGPALLSYFARIDAPIRSFEIGHVFSNDASPIVETPVVTFGFTADPIDEPAWRDTHFLRLKGEAEALIRTICGTSVETTRDKRTGFHPGKTAVLMQSGREIANFGKVDPRLTKAFDVRLPVYLCNIYLDNVPEYTVPTYRPPSKFPSTYRDLAMVVALDVSAERVSAVTKTALGALCTGVRVFDEYRGPQIGDGKKSLAVRATMQRTDATITDEQADEAIARAIAALRTELGATIRE